MSETISEHFAVYVRDDHESGRSVWYPEEDYMDADDAIALATKLSKERENRVARLVRCSVETASTFNDGVETPE